MWSISSKLGFHQRHSWSTVAQHTSVITSCWSTLVDRITVLLNNKVREETDGWGEGWGAAWHNAAIVSRHTGRLLNPSLPPLGHKGRLLNPSLPPLGHKGRLLNTSLPPLGHKGRLLNPSLTPPVYTGRLLLSSSLVPSKASGSS
jgi:hypothetical protein